MNKRTPLVLLLVLAGSIFAVGCQKTDATTPTDATPAAVKQSDEPAIVPPPGTTMPETTAPQTASATPLRDALNALFDHENNTASSAFPKGTRLLNVDLKDKVALVDVSKEFNQLQNKGESNEGQVQKHLCAALARFPSVDTLHLTVEGKDYESQAADWRSIPVRPQTDSSSSSSSSSTSSSPARNLQAAGSVDR